MEDVFDNHPLLCILLMFAVVVGTLFAFARWADMYQCASFGEVTGRQTRYVAMSCYVQQDGRWYSADELKLRNATKGQ